MKKYQRYERKNPYKLYLNYVLTSLKMMLFLIILHEILELFPDTNDIFKIQTFYTFLNKF